MKPGDLTQITIDQWRLDIIYRTDERWYIAAQRDAPSRRLFDGMATDPDELAEAVANHMTAIDIRDGLL